MKRGLRYWDAGRNTWTLTISTGIGRRQIGTNAMQSMPCWIWRQPKLPSPPWWVEFEMRSSRTKQPERATTQKPKNMRIGLSSRHRYSCTNRRLGTNLSDEIKRHPVQVKRNPAG